MIKKLQKTNKMTSNHNADSPKSSKMVLRRFFPILPLLLTLSAFVIGMLCLFAGSKPGFMEGYDIVTVRLPLHDSSNTKLICKTAQRLHTRILNR